MSAPGLVSRWLTWPSLDRYPDMGLLLLRVGLGAMMVGHGWPKLLAGPDLWAKLGAAMSALGVTVWPTFWGASAAVAETAGGALVVLGLAARPAAAIVAFTMFVAAANHLVSGDSFVATSHSIEVGIAFAAITWLGPGRYALERRLLR